MRAFFHSALLHPSSCHIYYRYTHNNKAINMTEPRVNCYIKFKKSAKDKVQALADRDHGGNFHAALHRVIEESKA